MYMDRWIKHASSYPVWLIRLVRPDRVEYEVRQTNVHLIVRGEVGELQNHFVHYSFNLGLRHWLHKHNDYSTLEAIEGVKIRRAGLTSLQGVAEVGVIARRRWLKNLSYFLALRPVWRFLHAYIVRGGFLDGSAGFHYGLLISMYEYWMELKMHECERRWRRSSDRQVRRLLAEDTAPGQAPSDAITVMIPTFNEADHIAQTITNARLLGPVFVLDSFSTDGTQQLARQAGATVIEHEFVSYSQQKNWGLDHVPHPTQWVFILDADERITPTLRREILRRIARNPRTDGYYVNRLMIFMGRPICQGGIFPSWNLRLMRRGRARYEERSVHEHVVCDGPTNYLHGIMLHLRRETISHFLEKHIHYADLESNEWIKSLAQHNVMPSALFTHPAGILRRRQWLRRQIWPRMPARPLWRFIYMYFVRLGILDGEAGWHLALLMACYEYMITMFYRDKMHQARQPKPPGEDVGHGRTPNA
jgi:glycosyltransferase involved in cell wall biosynthesis